MIINHCPVNIYKYNIYNNIMGIGISYIYNLHIISIGCNCILFKVKPHNIVICRVNT